MVWSDVAHLYAMLQWLLTWQVVSWILAPEALLIR